MEFQSTSHYESIAQWSICGKVENHDYLNKRGKYLMNVDRSQAVVVIKYND